VLDAPSATLLAVYSERAGWLEVEPASGMKVWVHGSFVKRTTTPGVVEITANNVRMRPLPSSDEKSFPLPTKLDKGERVRLIGRARREEARRRGLDPGVVARRRARVRRGRGHGRGRTPARTSARRGRRDRIGAGRDARRRARRRGSGEDRGGGDRAAASAEPRRAKAEPKTQAAYEKLADAEKLLVTARARGEPGLRPREAGLPGRDRGGPARGMRRGPRRPASTRSRSARRSSA
jgi:hypothetical protein